MKSISDTFGLVFENIPHINLRNEFTRYYAALDDNEFISQFENTTEPVQTPYMIWYGMQNDLITLIAQRIILGVESYLPGAVFSELGVRGKLNKDNLAYLRNPYSLKGRGTVDNYYHKLPSLLDGGISLKVANDKLWDKTIAFYKEVRNPIFHGKNLSKRDIKGLKRIFDYISEIYKWIDSWHDYSKILSLNKKGNKYKSNNRVQGMRDSSDQFGFDWLKMFRLFFKQENELHISHH